MSPAWLLFAYTAPALWLTFLVQAIRYRRWPYLGAFMLYAGLRLLFDLNWAALPTDPHAGIRLPIWMDVVGSVARCLVLAAAVLRVSFPDARTHAKWSVAAKAGIGLALVLVSGGLIAMGVVRVACFVAALAFDAIWLRHPYESFDFSIIHMILLTVMLGAGAFGVAFYRVVDGHCVQGCRGDAIDTTAIAIQCACLLAWIRLVSSPYFAKKRTRVGVLSACR